MYFAISRAERDFVHFLLHLSILTALVCSTFCSLSSIVFIFFQYQLGSCLRITSWVKLFRTWIVHSRNFLDWQCHQILKHSGISLEKRFVFKLRLLPFCISFCFRCFFSFVVCLIFIHVCKYIFLDLYQFNFFLRRVFGHRLANGESLLTSLFTFFLISIRLTS